MERTLAPARKIANRSKRGPKRVDRRNRTATTPPEVAETINAELPRPTRYTDALADEVCERLANGETATAICRDPRMPKWATLKRWEREDEDFARRYEVARKQCCEYHTDEIVEIADNAVNDYVMRADGKRVFDRESFERSRLRVDARKWNASKILRHTYGDKSEVDVRTPDGVTVRNEERNALIDALVKLVSPKQDGRTRPNDPRDEPRER